VARTRVAAAFEPALAAAGDWFTALARRGSGASMYLYGSVATGCARVATSDVDLLIVGVPSADTAALAVRPSRRFGDLCRGVEVASLRFEQLEGDGAEAYGNRAFLRHYCLHLAGADPVDRSREFPADERAARGFNGDIARHVERWWAALGAGADPGDLGRTAARKTLLAVAGLVSVHDRTWTTDRFRAAERWGRIEPASAASMRILVVWSQGIGPSSGSALERALDGPIADIADSFSRTVGLWG